MKKMKCTVIALVVVMLMVFTLTGCKPEEPAQRSFSEVYAMAQDAGYEGTMEELVALFKGEKGDKGDTGAAGAAGAKGDKGDDGVGVKSARISNEGHLIVVYTNSETEVDLGQVVGAAGATGATGAKGDKGDTGVAGATGEKGEKGDKGDKGDTGVAGVAGVTGATGKSAYELYKATYNYTGTEAEWLKAIADGALAEKTTVTITYETEGGNLAKTSDTVNKGDCIDLPYPEKDLSVFKGWFTKGGVNETIQVTNFTPISKNITVYAKWEDMKAAEASLIPHGVKNAVDANYTVYGWTEDSGTFNYVQEGSTWWFAYAAVQYKNADNEYVKSFEAGTVFSLEGTVRYTSGHSEYATIGISLNNNSSATNSGAGVIRLECNSHFYRYIKNDQTEPINWDMTGSNYDSLTQPQRDAGEVSIQAQRIRVMVLGDGSVKMYINDVLCHTYAAGTFTGGEIGFFTYNVSAATVTDISLIVG